MTMVTEDVAKMLIEIEDIANRMAGGIAALTVICESRLVDENTAAHKALCYLAENLGTEIETITDALYTIRQQVNAPEAA